MGQKEDVMEEKKLHFVEHEEDGELGTDLFTYGNYLIQKTKTPDGFMYRAKADMREIMISCMEQDGLVEEPLCSIQNVSFTEGSGADLVMRDLEEGREIMTLLKEGKISEEYCS